MSDILILKANILGGMNEYIFEIVNDEDDLNYWEIYGIPDGCTEEMLMELAGDNDCFRDITNTFLTLIKDIR